MSLLGKSWKYINEGNVHVVLCVLNTDYVIRLIKEDGSVNEMKTIRNYVNFVNIVMIPLIFGKTVYKEEIIKMSPQDIANLYESLLSTRPKHRQVKSIFSQFAIKAPNLTMVSHNSENYCLEIKPKEGFISSNLRQYSKCYYCLKQISKLQEKQIERISGYCPLDLFCGERRRMRKALLNLIQNPQNNLKLFKDGNIIYNERSNLKDFEILVRKTSIFHSLEIFLDFVIEILLGDGASDITLKESNGVLNSRSEKGSDSNNLSENCFLNQLLALQKLSETLDLDSIDTNEDFQYVAELLKNIKELNIDLVKSDDRRKFFETVEPIHLAMISAVAKDCSIMISFSPESHESHPSIKIRDKTIFYKISATDLEPKSIKSLTKRKKTELKLIELYKNVNEKKLNSFNHIQKQEPNSWKHGSN